MKKRLAVMAASTLLAVAPIATVITSIATTQTVSAAEMSPSQLMHDYYESYDGYYPLIKLTKKTPYLTAYPGQTVNSLSKKQIKDITSNYGHVSKMTSMDVYKANDEGRPDFGRVLKKNFALKFGENYVAALRFDMSGFPEKYADDKLYAYFEQSPSNSDLEQDAVYIRDTADDVTLLVPVHVDGTKPASTSISAKGYVNTRKRNSKVRTYTSTGKFSKHYVYGHHTYRLNQKKNIDGLGLCYKIYGKNQWIPASKLSLRQQFQF